MDILAFASFAILVVGWLIAPGGTNAATAEHAALEQKAA